jgi:hypothetical protein
MPETLPEKKILASLGVEEEEVEDFEDPQIPESLDSPTKNSKVYTLFGSWMVEMVDFMSMELPFSMIFAFAVDTADHASKNLVTQYISGRYHWALADVRRSALVLYGAYTNVDNRLVTSFR